MPDPTTLRDNVTGLHLTAAQKLAWLRLIRSENVGPSTFRLLINRYGSAEDALDALPELSSRGGLKRRIRICPEDRALAEIDATDRQSLKIIASGEPEFPVPLAHTDGGPPLIFVRGKSDILNRPGIAIVGSRNCSASGARLANEISADLAEAGFVVVSGLARGIDGAAHRASVSNGTIAVLAGGADTVYPVEHTELAEEIAQNGALISEMPVGYLPRARDFPRRNRIISGMSFGTVVIEAATRSGSLITARLAAEQGREVFAVPGSPLDPRSDGTNRLLKQGAQFVTSAQDVIDAMEPILEKPLDSISSVSSGLDTGATDWRDLGSNEREKVTSALGAAPATLDDVIRHTGLATSDVLTVIMELELAGRIEHHPGQRVSIKL